VKKNIFCFIFMFFLCFCIFAEENNDNSPPSLSLIFHNIGWNTLNSFAYNYGMALVQTLMLSLAIQTPLKMITGRALPGIVTELDHTRNLPTENFSNEFSWFNMNPIGGWPSAHTLYSFAAAATISKIYNENIWLKVGVFSYAALIGFGVTLDVHWASDALGACRT